MLGAALWRGPTGKRPERGLNPSTQEELNPANNYEEVDLSQLSLEMTEALGEDPAKPHFNP